ncbi:hypothetical protein [Rhizobium leguminosarum]|uniref:Cap15 family cyclic dinucleotide receptor domain-containing protein n=1 Tax=Rhizobium leguminosarum TaxID=384 RepID=UPI003F9B6BA1
MFRVIDFVVLIRLVAVGTTVLTLLLYTLIERYFPQILTIVRPFTLAPTIALVFTFLLTSKWISRRIWKIARFFNGSLYPDLNGVWEGEIIFEDDKGTLEARAVIRQFLLNTEIDMHTATAKSSTLEATPVISSGQFKLYYTYSTRPKKTDYGTYTGSTIFDIRLVGDETKTLELSGYYYTDRATRGRTRLRQISSDNNTDVSFY